MKLTMDSTLRDAAAMLFEGGNDSLAIILQDFGTKRLAGVSVKTMDPDEIAAALVATNKARLLN